MDDQCLGGASVLAVDDHITGIHVVRIRCLVGWIRGLRE